MYLSTTKSAALLANIFGGSASVSIGTQDKCWLGLFTTVPNDSGGSYVEVSGNNYSRRNIASQMSTSYKSHAKGESSTTSHTRMIGNTTDITFPEAYNPSDPDVATGADWGTIYGWGLFSAQSGGAPYAWGELSNTGGVAINTHNVFVFRAGYFEVELQDGEIVSLATGGT